MNIMERILLLIYFPQFKSPNCSRFESFFVSMLKKENSLPKQIYKSKEIYPEKIVRNEDKRTSLIIKGIPMDISKNEIRNFIEKFGNLNYLYIEKDSASEQKNTSIAYINLINYKSIIPLFMKLRNYKIERNEQIFYIKIMYSNIQGKKQLKQYINKNYYYKYSD